MIKTYTLTALTKGTDLFPARNSSFSNTSTTAFNNLKYINDYSGYYYSGYADPYYYAICVFFGKTNSTALDTIDHLASLPSSDIVEIKLTMYISGSNYNQKNDIFWAKANNTTTTVGTNLSQDGTRETIPMRTSATTDGIFTWDVTSKGFPATGGWYFHYDSASLGGLHLACRVSKVVLTVTTNEVEERTYSLVSNRSHGGRRAHTTSSTWNMYSVDAFLCGYDYIRGRDHATYYMFNLSDLADLKNKTVTSVKLAVTITGMPNSSTSISHKLTYKLNGVLGASSTNTAWNAGNNICYVNTSSCVSSGSLRTFTIGNTASAIPDYGFVFGPYDCLHATGNEYCVLSSTATLIITTEEYDLPYILEYNGNGGSNEPASLSGSNQLEPPSYTFTISSSIPTRAGYEFLGWALSPSVSSAAYLPGDTLTVSTTGVTTLYAIWKALNIIKIVNSNNELDIYLIYIVENNDLVPYRATIVNSNNELDICT